MGHNLNPSMTTRRSYGSTSFVQAAEAPPPAAGRRDSTQISDLSGFINILRRYLPSIAFCTLAALTLALIYLALATPIYTAATTLFIDPRSRKIVSDETVQGGLGSDFALVESQVNIIGSDAVLKRVVDTLNLTNDPEFVWPQSTGLMSRIAALIRGRTVPPEPAIQALESLARSIKVKRAQKTYVVDIEVSSTSPVKAARLTNAIVDAYIADQKAAKTDEARRANVLIDSRLGELREQVRMAEIRADEFKKANKILTSEGGIVTEQQLGKLNTELITSRAVAAESKARLEQAASALKTGANPETLPEAMKSGLVAKLRDQYAQVARREAALASQLGGRHPVLIEVRSQLVEIKAQIAAELKRIGASANNDYQIAANRERELTANLERLKEEVGRTNTAQIKLRELEQEVNASRELLRQFLARSKQTEEEQKISTSEARIISPAAVPSHPSKPLTWLVLALGGLGGLGLGIARALIKDYVDPSVRDLSEASIALNAPELATIPNLGGTSVPMWIERLLGMSGRPEAMASFSDLMLAISDPKGKRALQYRQSVLRLLRQLRSGAEPGKPTTVMFMAALPDSGASATALAIAYAAALAGDRVLLVDAASTDAELSGVFASELKGDQVVVLDSKEHLSRITTRDARSGLSFLPIALADIRTMKGVQRKRLVAGLTALADEYELIIIDAGSLLEDESAASLVPAVAHVVLVVRAMETSRYALREMSQMLEQESERIAGVVLTMTRSSEL